MATRPANTRRLPDFVIAGSRKCSTTWLHRCISEHPQIFVPSEAKELFFFDRHWNRGPEWYSRFFQGCPPGKICGEATPGYFNHPDAPARINALIPDVKLIFIFRNPIERTVSLYFHMRALGKTRLPFEEALQRFPNLIDEGLYHHHLMRFERLFGRKALLPLIAENVRATGPDGLAPLFRFLNVDDRFRPPSFHERTYERREPRGHLLAKAAFRVATALRDMGLHKLTDAIKSGGAERLVFKGRPIKKFTMDTATAERLRAVYREDARRLGDYLQQDLTTLWNLEPD